MFRKPFRPTAGLLALFGAFAGLASAAAPVLMFSDLDSGPNTGGENNQGVFICLYGRNFGAAQSTSVISVGGTPASAYKMWGASGLPTAPDKACFQMGAATPQGPNAIAMEVNGARSNVLSFTVRPGNIHFLDPANVSGAASDGNPGTVSAPWLTYDKATHATAAGDTTYVRASVTTARSKTSVRGVLVPYGSGTLGNNKAIVAYPGESVVVGQDTDDPSCAGSCHGIYNNSAFVSLTDYWTISGIEAHGAASAIGFAGGAHLRVVANRATCPNENNWLACVYFSQQDNDLQVYGNEVFNVGTNVAGGATKGTHHLYFGTDDFNLEAGWNWIHTGHACRGIQIHSSPVNGGGTNDPTGNNLYNISLHDNWIEDVGCDGINLATIDPSKGPVTVYNNIIKHVGTGNHAGDSSDYAAILVGGLTNRRIAGPGTWSASRSALTITGVGTNFTALKRGWNLVDANGYAWYLDQILSDTQATVLSLGSYQGPDVPAGTPVVYQEAGAGEVEIYNNTIYDAGPCTGTGAVNSTSCGAFSRTRYYSYGSPLLNMHLVNNLVQQVASEPYFVNSAAGWTTFISGTNNLFYGGVGAIPTTGTINADPLFVAPGSDFHLQAGSPADGAGTSTEFSSVDFDGTPRLSASVTMGAYEAAGRTATTSASACDLNGDGLVDKLDVRSAMDQAIGAVACGSAAKIANDCNVVSVQRVIIASLGGACRTGL